MALASVLSAGRYNLAWYAGRFYQLVTATVVMVVLLAEMTRLYAGLARSNTMLQRERMMLQRAIDAQRRERDARLMTGDAVAATIAHEVKQPLAAMITRSDTGLRWLDRAVPDLDKAKAAFRDIAADGHRAAAVIESIRANFRKDARVRAPVDVDDLIRRSLELLQDDLKSHRISVKSSEVARLLQVMGDRIQLQQVLLNLITNAIDAMAKRRGPSRSRREFRVPGRWRCDDFGRRHGHGHRRAGRAAGIQSTFHHEIRRDGNGPFDLPFDRRGSRWHAVGRAQPTTRLGFSARSERHYRNIRQRRVRLREPRALFPPKRAAPVANGTGVSDLLGDFGSSTP